MLSVNSLCIINYILTTVAYLALPLYSEPSGPFHGPGIVWCLTSGTAFALLLL